MAEQPNVTEPVVSKPKSTTPVFYSIPDTASAVQPVVYEPKQVLLPNLLTTDLNIFVPSTNLTPTGKVLLVFLVFMKRLLISLGTKQQVSSPYILFPFTRISLSN